MQPRKVIVVCAVALVLATAGIVAIWPDSSDEEQVREAIRAVAAGAREADLAATLRPVSDDYTDAQGITRDELKLFLFREFQRRGPIAVLLSDIDVTLAGDIAVAEFGATLADGMEPGRLDFVPGDADAFRFTADLVREDGEWRIVGARYERSASMIPGLR